MRRAALVAVALVLAACGGDADDDAAFCEAMQGVATRMAPDDERTSPAVVEQEFGEVVAFLDDAVEAAPDGLQGDVAALAAAIDEYVAALADAGYDLDVIFSTPEGTQLAIDSSHALTPAVVQHMRGPCGIELE